MKSLNFHEYVVRKRADLYPSSGIPSLLKIQDKRSCFITLPRCNPSPPSLPENNSLRPQSAHSRSSRSVPKTFKSQVQSACISRGCSGGKFLRSGRSAPRAGRERQRWTRGLHTPRSIVRLQRAPLLGDDAEPTPTTPGINHAVREVQVRTRNR